jgi:NADH-quinone oxidoreductase subunit J
MVLFLFVIMLLGVDRRDALIEPLPGQRPLAVGLGALLVAEITYVAWQGVDLIQNVGANTAALEALNRDPGNVRALAGVLFGRYLLPFELTSILLVVAIVGVIVLARRMTIVPDSVSASERTDAEEAA